MLEKIVSFLKTDIKEFGKTKNIDKEKIGDNTVEMHNQALSEIKLLGSIVKNLDVGFFTSSTFTSYLDMKSSFNNGTNQYQGLGKCTELFCLAVKAQANFLKIEQTELRYRGRKQQDFYDFVFDLLRQKFDTSEDGEKNLELGVVNAKRKGEKDYYPDTFKEQIEGK